MANPHGSFIWYELLTTDPGGAADFYGKVVGWSVRDAGMGDDMPYSIFSAGGTDVGGMMGLSSEMQAGGARPGWLGYVGVEDVDAAVESIRHGGATIHIPPIDIPGVGRFALVADPDGAVFYVMKGASGEESRAFSPDGIGHCQWNELSTPDPERALHFYGTRFGWTRGDKMPMGKMGDYQFIEHHHRAIGAVTPTPPGQPGGWLYYFGVADIDAATEAARAAGATVMHGPAEVPGHVHIVIASDPQGAVFALVGPRKES